MSKINLNSLLTGLRNLLIEPEDVVNEKFEKVTIEGKEVQIELSGRELSSEVNMIDADGKSTPAPNGDYELSDGFKFTVVDGKISAIVEDKPEKEAKVEEELAAEDAPAETPDVQAEIDALKAEVEALKELVKGLVEKPEPASKEDFNKVQSDFNNQEELVNKLIEALKLIPTEFSKVDNTPKAYNKKAEDMARLANAFKK